MHDFSVFIPSCYKDDHGNSFFPGTATIMVIMLWGFFMLSQIFLSSQVTQSMITNNKEGVYKLPQELLNN